jgi:hypothetical protein
MKLNLVYFLAFLALAGLYSCVLTKGKEKPKEPIIKLLLSIEEGPCTGKCSRYDAQFFSGQKMVYKGISRMKIIGDYAYFIPEQLPKNLLAEAASLKLAELADSIPSEEGEQRIRIRFLQQNGSLKRISAGVRTAPPAFRSFIRLVDNEVRSMTEDQEGEKIK